MLTDRLDYPPRLRLAQRPTPLQFLPRASQRWGHGKRLWVKRDDLTGTVLTGNKVRKLEFFAAHAREQGYDTLITCGGLQSNHARATAAVCAQLGLHCELVLRGSSPEDTGNTLLDHLLGAEVHAVAADIYTQSLDELLDAAAERQIARGRKPLIIPTGGSNGLGVWGYISAAEELRQDFETAGIQAPIVVTATGSGGTQAGLSLGMALFDPAVRVVGMAVSDDEDWFNRKVLADIDEARQLWPQLPRVNVTPWTIDGYVGPGYGIAQPEVYQIIVELARLEGLVLDPVYTGKAFLGLTAELAAGRMADANDIVFVHTGGVFGMFPHHAGLREALDRGTQVAT